MPVQNVIKLWSMLRIRFSNTTTETEVGGKNVMNGCSIELEKKSLTCPEIARQKNNKRRTQKKKKN